jgi:hypothetical protein
MVNSISHVSYLVMMFSNNVGPTLLQTGTIATRTHFTAAMSLIWPIAIVAMRHSSDGRPQHHRPVKLVVTDER